MTPPTDRLRRTPSHSPASAVAAPRSGAPSIRWRIERVLGASEAAGAAMSAIGRIVPTAGMRTTIVAHTRPRMSVSAQVADRPLAR